MGTPDFAVPALKAIHESKHQICTVVTNPDKPFGRGQKLKPSDVKIVAEKLNYPILQPTKLNESQFLNEINALNPDLFVVVAFKKLPPQLYNIAKHGAVNIHASLLPKYRGAAPIHHAILNGDKETGVTTFQINEKIDTGNILFQEKINIDLTDTVGSLWIKLSNLGKNVILKTLDQFDLGKMNYQMQDNQIATKAPKIKPEDIKINWNNSAISIHNQIRAFSPKPGAYTTLNGKRLKLLSTSICNPLDEYNNGLPGKIIVNKNIMIIITGDGTLNVLEIQLEGKPKMNVKSYLAGNKIGEDAICL